MTVDELDEIAGFLDVDPGLLFLAPEDLIRNRWFALSQVPMVEGQMELALGEQPVAPRLVVAATG